MINTSEPIPYDHVRQSSLTELSDQQTELSDQQTDVWQGLQFLDDRFDNSRHGLKEKRLCRLKLWRCNQ
jgi:hypothetical protein